MGEAGAVAVPDEGVEDGDESGREEESEYEQHDEVEPSVSLTGAELEAAEALADANGREAAEAEQGDGVEGEGDDETDAD